MTLIPRHRVLRRAAVLWLAASMASLFVLLTNPDIAGNARSPLRVLLPLYFLSLPLGHAGVWAISELKLELYLQGNPPPGILLEGLALWTGLTVLGYAQWRRSLLARQAPST